MDLASLRELRKLLGEYDGFCNLSPGTDHARAMDLVITSLDIAIRATSVGAIKVKRAGSVPIPREIDKMLSVVEREGTASSDASGGVSSLAITQLGTPDSTPLKIILKFIVSKQGDSWKYCDVTSSRLSRWTNDKWNTAKARRALGRLVKAGYAVKSGREAGSRRIESSGTTCVTYSLRSDRVERLLSSST